MPDSHTVRLKKETTLLEVNKVVAQSEGNLGPLIAMGIEGERTTFSFDVDEDPPENSTVVVPAAGSDDLAGSVKVCEGEIFIKGKRTPSIAFRTK